MGERRCLVVPNAVWPYRMRLLLHALLLCALTASGANAQTTAQEIQSLSRLIDARIAERWERDRVTPAPLANDSEFMRRLYLDVTGKIPHAAEVRDFLNDADPNKRQRLINTLLQRPSYIIHYTNLWRAAMIPEAAADPQIRFALPGFEAWLRSRIAENRNFAEIVHELLTLPIDERSLARFTQPDESTPAAFYLAKEAKPERLAAATSRLFLGLRIDCAQCHDHPFDHWKQDQFWQHAAFFTDFPQQGQAEQAPPDQSTPGGSIRIPESGRVVTAAFLDQGDAADAVPSGDRKTLSEWITRRENPYFAKAAVNRLWSYHFGIGLVEPMDDFSANNPPSHPELLEELALAFVESGFDFKFMIRAITNSRTYQLTSRQTDPSQSQASLFARMAVRGLTAEQLFDSLAVATGYRQPFDPEQPLNFNKDQARQEFISTFGNQTESAPQRTSTVLQALVLMNGDFVGTATDLSESRTLAAVIDAPFLTRQEKINSLYLTTLCRLPTAEEAVEIQRYLENSANDGQQLEALADVFWVLLNSSEFLLNH